MSNMCIMVMALFVPSIHRRHLRCCISIYSPSIWTINLFILYSTYCVVHSHLMYYKPAHVHLPC